MNEWAAEIPGGESAARAVAQRHGMDLVRSIGSLPNHYLFRHRRLSKRSADAAHDHHSRIVSDEDVTWAEQQRAKVRRKRDGFADDHASARRRRAPTGDADRPAMFDNFRDPLWHKQWYLHAGGIGHSDMQVREAWEQGKKDVGIILPSLFLLRLAVNFTF